jgi:hypothetical protein
MTYDSIHMDLLNRYTQHRRQAEAERWQAEAERRRAGAERRTASQWHVAEANQIKAELYEHWRERGWNPRDLDKLLRKIDYREGVMVLYAGPATVFAAKAHKKAEAQQRKLASELQTFWTASGHDLKELNAFLSEVDTDIFDLLPR